MKIGILGTGGISRAVAPTLAAMEEIECYAVASRSQEKARAFAGEFGFEKAYGSYEALVSDPAVELVYVASPHSHHYAHMMLALSHGKHVLCEKAFTVNAAQAAMIRDYAAAQKLYAAEALWPRYMPSRRIIDEVIGSGIIGKPSILTANLSYVISENRRIVDPQLAGGALLDVGVYGLNFMMMHFGDDIARIAASAQMTDTGVDATEAIAVYYKDGRMANLTHGIYARSDRKGIIYGDEGYIVVENINNPQSVSVFDTRDKLLQQREFRHRLSGYEYEFAEAVRYIREGKTESGSMPLSESIRMMERMDEIRSQWGLVYPMERG